MNFEEELNKRTESAKTKIKDQEQKRALAKKRMDLIIDIKKTIESSVFEKVCKSFPNAEISETHVIENDEIVPIMGTFNCCIIEFAKNDTYEFPTAARFIIEVELSDDLNIVKFVSAYAIGKKNQAKFTGGFAEMLRTLDTEKKLGKFFYDGHYEKNSVIEAVQKVTLNFLDAYKEAVKNLK